MYNKYEQGIEIKLKMIRHSEYMYKYSRCAIQKLSYIQNEIVMLWEIPTTINIKKKTTV